MEAIKNATQHAAALNRITTLMQGDPPAESDAGRELDALAAIVETWEHASLLLADLAPPDIEEQCDECGGDGDVCKRTNPECPYPKVRKALATT